MRIYPSRNHDRREVPRYTIAEVALYLGLRPRTLHTWFFGRAYAAKGTKEFWSPLATPAERNPRGPALSFYNLAEAHVLAATGQGFSISVKAIRHAIDTLLRLYPSEHPLISRYFETDGPDVFIYRDAAPVNLGV